MQNESSTYPVITTDLFSLNTSYGHDCTGIHISSGATNAPALLYAMGWGTNDTLHAPTMRAFASQGHDIWSINPPRIGDTTPMTEFSIPAVEVHKAAGVVSLLERLYAEGITETDIVLHSESAIYASLAVVLAAENPSAAKVRSIIYVEPAGLTGKEHPLILTSRFAKEAVGNLLLDPRFYIANRRSTKGMLRPRITRHEAAAIAQTDLVALITQLHTKYGVKIGIIAGEHDGVFPASRIEETLERLTIPHAYKALPIRHNGMYMEDQLIVREVKLMLNELNGTEDGKDQGNSL